MKKPEIIKALKQIAARNGGMLMPEEVVKAARPAGSTLHKYFTWDDTDAAAKCRLQEARQLINVCVEYIGGKKELESRVFVSLRSDRLEGGYRPLVTVLTNRQMREELLADAIEEMKYFQTKYRGLRELADVFAAMRKLAH